MDRYIDLDGTFNFRDIGGYQGFDEKTVTYGKLFRSDELSKISSSDIDKIKKIGIQTIIDYRSTQERVNNEDVYIEGVQTFYLDPKADVAAMASAELSGRENTLHDPSALTAEFAKTLMTKQNIEFVVNEESIKAYRKMFDVILDEKNIGIVQHCRGGKDRTGYGIALILFSLGVSKENIVEDYMLTNFYKKDKNEKSLALLFEQYQDEDKVQAFRYLKEAQESFLLAALDKIDELYGSPMNYLKEVIKLSDRELNKLKELYLV